MTKLQKHKITACIKKGCTLASRYIDGKGNYCVIGGLLKVAGFDIQPFETSYWQNHANINDPSMAAARQHLLTHYGIDEQLALTLQVTNDNYFNVVERREALIAALP